MLGFRTGSQERILETFSVQKGGFSKASGQDLLAERAHWGRERWRIIYVQVGRELETDKFSK